MVVGSKTEILEGGVYIYFGPRMLPFLRKQTGILKVLKLDIRREIVHVRTYEQSDNEEENPRIYINHIPIEKGILEKCLKEYVGISKEIMDEETSNAICEWEKKYDLGEAAAFSIPVYKAEKYVSNIVSEQNERNLIEELLVVTAYPKLSDKGQYSRIAVEVGRRLS